jgi:hypothetical protein
MTQILPRAFKCISMRHQNRQGGIGEGIPGRAAEDHLAQAALCVRGLDQQVAAERHRVVENDLSGRAGSALDRQRGRFDPVPAQVARQSEQNCDHVSY